MSAWSNFKRGFNWGASRGSTFKGMVRGATIGGIYGAFADDTSFLGGAATGAGIGAGIGMAYPSAIAGARVFRRAKGLPFGARVGQAGQAMWHQARWRAGNTYANIGSTLTKAYGGMRSFGGGFMSGWRGT